MFRWAQKVGRFATRLFEAAKTDRLNETQWTDADKDQSINEGLSLDLETCRRRSIYESCNNSFAAGVIDTHCGDVVGCNGPTLQVHSDVEKYNTLLESVWRSWWDAPDLAGVRTGSDVLRQWARLLWTCGEFFEQITDDGSESTRHITLRLTDVHPRRLASPFGAEADGRISMGIERDRVGRPLRYYVTDFSTDESFDLRNLDVRPFEAESIIHGFKRDEPGQIRGYPWLSPSLQVIADVRDYDKHVLDTAKAAAMFGVLLTTDHPDSNYVAVNEETEFKRFSVRTAPPGWDAKTITSNQPMPQYADFRRERLRELGRGVSMPLMMIMLDSSRHNFSSARFDGQIYQRGIKAQQRGFERNLNRLVDLVAKEAELLRFIPRRPARVTYAWAWDPIPYVDPDKETKAAERRVKNLLSTITDELAGQGRDLDRLTATLQREIVALEGIGITHPIVLAQQAATASAAQPANGARGLDEEDVRDLIRDYLESEVVLTNE